MFQAQVDPLFLGIPDHRLPQFDAVLCSLRVRNAVFAHSGKRDDTRAADFNGQVDAAFGSTVTGPSKNLEASPRGIYWPPMAHDDEAGWKRLMAKAPYFVKHVATLGTGISADKPHVGGAYPYPILITRADQDAALVYSMTKAIHSKYDSFKVKSKEIGNKVFYYRPGSARTSTNA